MSEADEKTDLMAIDDVGDELSEIIDWAIAFKHGGDLSSDFKPLDGMSIGSIYEKPSTRTRVSFEVGVSRLGGQSLTLLSNDIQLGKSESIADTAAVLSRFLDGITYRCFEHADAVDLAEHSGAGNQRAIRPAPPMPGSSRSDDHSGAWGERQRTHRLGG